MTDTVEERPGERKEAGRGKEKRDRMWRWRAGEIKREEGAHETRI